MEYGIWNMVTKENELTESPPHMAFPLQTLDKILHTVTHIGGCVHSEIFFFYSFYLVTKRNFYKYEL